MPILIHTGCETEDEARNIARTLLQRRIAAAVHVRRIDTFYRWEDDIHERQEWRLDIKTTKILRARVIAAVSEMHSYDEPAIYSINIDHMTPSAIAWIGNCCNG